MVRSVWRGVLVAIMAAGVGCKTRFGGYCDENEPCPSGSYCDLTGEYPASAGHGRVCIPTPFDASPSAVDDAALGDGPTGPMATVTVSKDGPGSAVVSSNVPGLDCGDICTASFPLDSTITLAAVPEPGSRFLGWTGDCSGTSGTADCQLTLGGDKAVGATLSGGGVLWSFAAGGSYNDTVNSIAVDALGNVGITGKYAHDITIGGTTLYTGSFNQGLYFVAVFNPDGTVKWARGSDPQDSFSGAYGFGVAFDADGYVYTTGSFSGTVDLGNGPQASGPMGAAFLCKYTPGGSGQWCLTFAGDGAVTGRTVAIDGSGNIILQGFLAGTVDFGSLVTAASSDGLDIFVAKFDGFGFAQWATTVVAGGYNTDAKVCADGSQSIVLATSFEGSATLPGGFYYTTYGGTDVLLAKLLPSGTVDWVQHFGGVGQDGVPSVSCDPGGEIAVAAYSNDAADYGGGVIPGGSTADSVVARYGPDGSHQWSVRSTGSGHDGPGGIAVGPDHAIIVTGTFDGTFDLGSPLSTTNMDMYVTKFTSLGDHVWSQALGGSSFDRAVALTTSPAGTILLGGDFQDTIMFGADSYSSVDIGDLFLVVLGP